MSSFWSTYGLPPRCYVRPPRRFHPAQDLHGARSHDTQTQLRRGGFALPSRLDRWALRQYATRHRYRQQFAVGYYNNADGHNYGRADFWNNLTRGQASTRSRSLILPTA